MGETEELEWDDELDMIPCELVFDGENQLMSDSRCSSADFEKAWNKLPYLRMYYVQEIK